MAENILKVAANTPEQQNKVAANTTAPQSKAPESIPAKQNDDTVSPAYILGQIEKIQSELFNLAFNIGAIGGINCDGDGPQMTVLEAKLEAINDMFNRREETINKLISFYEKIYDDMVHANKK